MNDIRISTGLLHHFKIHKLKKIIGPEAVERLLQLWIFTAMNKPSGELTDMDVIDIETAAGWNGDNGKFLEALKTCKLIDYDICGFSIHDWISNQGWVAGSTERSEKGRMATLKQNYPDIYKKLAAQGVTRITPEEYFRVTQGIPKGDPMGTQGFASAPSPSPSPSPLPPPIPEKDKNSCPADAVREIEKQDISSEPEDKVADGDFERLWSIYPRKTGKGAARKAFHKAIKKVECVDVMLDAIDWQKKSDQWKDPQFVPHAATWLNQERWLDEPSHAEVYDDTIRRDLDDGYGPMTDKTRHDFFDGPDDEIIETLNHGNLTRRDCREERRRTWILACDVNGWKHKDGVIIERGNGNPF